MNNLTQAAYAAHRKAQGLRGTSSRAVRRALAAGRIHSERGGGIDPERADLEWGATTRLRIDSTKAQRALMHPCHAASWDLTTLLLRIEKCINAILKETVKGAPNYQTVAWPRFDRQWRKLPDALARLQTELKAAVPLCAEEEKEPMTKPMASHHPQGEPTCL